MAPADPPPFEHLLRLGDNCLVLGHRLSEWCGRGPALEEDIALANTALDLIGQARFWLDLAGEVEGRGRTADELAFLRESRAFRNLLLVEQKNGDFAVTMTRQFFFDAWHWLLLDRLQHSADPRIAEIAAKALKEVAYHLERSGDWIVRLGDGTEESHRRAQAAVDHLWVYTGELFETDEVDRAAGVDPTALRQPWLDLVGRTLAGATLEMPDPDAWMHKGGKRGLHTEELGYLLAVMQSVHRAHPGATW
jgi:ring-1,2-phenylacetyl-CoA epoxidase subunit PaaC